MVTYAGIGSRQTPDNIFLSFIGIGERLARQGAVLRSGGAHGADSAFEQGAKQVAGQMEIYLPWPKFNNNSSPLYPGNGIPYTTWMHAQRVAKHFHPRGDSLDGPALKLMARNSFQVLGRDLNSPVDFLICWTAGGLKSGGTSQALRIAEHYKIPWVNFQRSGCTKKVEEIENLYEIKIF